MTIIPFRRSQQVQTDAMADTEAASSIPPWPCDISPRPSAVEQGPTGDESMEMLGRLIAYAVSVGVVGFALWAALS